MIFFSNSFFLEPFFMEPFFVRGECSCTPVCFFAIISMQRSGSGWFETLLNSHPNVSSNGEIFSAKDRRENISSILRTLDKLYNMDWLTSAAKNECTAAFGLKWMLNHVSICILSPLFAWVSKGVLSHLLS
jgi:LPS sulfotransferase NodH